MTKCEEIGDVALMEIAEPGMRTEDKAAETGRKRKVSGELNCSSTSLVKLRNRRRRLVLEVDASKSEEEASFSNELCASCYSSNGSTELDKESNSKFLDLEELDFVQRSKSAYEFDSCRERRETTPSSEIQAESSKLEEESPARPAASEVNFHRQSMDEKKKMPSDAEIDAFFASAEKDLLKHYSERYNFDFEEEEPLEGRYSWIKVKP